jgi:ribosomal protein L11 methyltransferase
VSGAGFSGGASGPWRIAVTVPDEASGEVVAAAIGAAAAAVSAFETAPGGAWRVEGYSAQEPDRGTLAAACAVAALSLEAGAAAALAVLTIERLPDADWLALNQASFPPLAIGRYFIYGSHHAAGAPTGRIGLRIDAAAAFGTGEHATTRGCLLAFEGLARARRFRRPLDMGTGTAILAMAVARTAPARVLASDIDAGSLRVAAQNLRVNGLARTVRLRRSDGFAARDIHRRAPFDLVFANILARPLMLMARDLAAGLAPGGVAILSGLLVRQAPSVLAAYRAAGLSLRRRIVIGEWATLVLARGAGARRRG